MKKLFKFFQRLSSRSLPIWDNIEDMPVWNWMRVHEKGDLRYIYKISSDRELPSQCPDMDCWRRLYDQYIREFGINERYLEYLQKKKDIAIKKCDRIISGDRSLETLIEVDEIELRDMLSAGENMKFIEVIAAIEKHLGFQLNQHTVTVVKYYTYLRQIEKSVSRGKNSIR